MERLFLIILIACLPILTTGQIKYDFDTSIIVGKEKQIYQQRQIKIGKDGNKYVAGFFKGDLTIENVTISTISPISYFTSQAIFLAKYDSTNKFLWLKKIAESDTLNNFSFEKDTVKNLIFAVGYAGKLYYESDSVTSFGNYDVILLSYDTASTFKHKNRIGSINGEIITENSVTYDDTGNYYVCGSYNKTWAGNFQNYKLGIGYDTLTTNNEDLFIAKFDSVGNNLWAKSYGAQGIDGLSSLCFYNSRIYFMGGVTANSLSIGGIPINYPNNYQSKYFLAQLDINGVGIWLKYFGNEYNNGLGYVSPKNMTVKSNRVYFTGIGSDQNQLVCLFEGGSSLAGGNGNFDYFIAGYDTLGNFKWNIIAKSPYDEYLNQLNIDSLGNVYGIGNMVFSSYFPNDTLYTNGSDDVLLCSYDSSGNFRWATHGGGVSTDIGSSIALDNNGKIFIVGGTTSSGGCMMGNDTLYPPANQSTMFFASLDSIDAPWPLQNTVQFQNSFQIEVYPNPAYKYLYVDMKQVVTQTKNEHTLIKMQNALGQIVYMTQVAENYSNTPNSLHTIDISSYPNGMYFLSLISDQQAISKKIIIQH
jgi:hypothetical protein